MKIDTKTFIIISLIIIIVIIVSSLMVRSYQSQKALSYNQTLAQGYNLCLYQNNQYIIQSLQQYGSVTYNIFSDNQTYAVQLVLNQSRRLT